MARWTTRERQKMIDSYLNASGKNLFVPREFLAWLRPQEDHPLHETFFGRSDEELAQAMREDMVRGWISGLRITVQHVTKTAEVSSVLVHEIPAYVSPEAGRKLGGGYLRGDDPEMADELLRQAAGALDAWLRRFSGVAAVAGVNVEPITEIAGLLAGGVVSSAA